MNRALDSFSLIVPFQNVTWYDSHLTERVLEVYENTGIIRNQADLENPEKLNRKPLFKDGKNDGIKCRVSATSFFGEQCLIVVCTSKMLRSKYLQGITINNVRDLYDYVTSLSFFTMEYEDFLKCQIFDIDIKTDYEMDQYEYEHTLREKRKHVKGSKLFFNKDRTVQGLQYGNRNAKITLSNPFVKTYSKGVELTSNSSVFHNLYIPSFFNDNLRRTEVCIANSKIVDSLVRKKILHFKPTNLIEWLSLSQEVYRNIILHLINVWESPYSFVQARKSLKKKKMSSTNFAIMKMYELLKNDGYTIQDMANLLDSYPAKDEVKSSSKSRFKSKITDFDILLTETSEQMKQLGIYKLL